MSARQDTESVQQRLNARGIAATLTQAQTLRRAAATLSRWAEEECGWCDAYASYAIERDDDTGKPYRAIYPHNGPSRRYAIPDRERGALARVKAVCDALGAHFYHQTDPRGASLYVSREPMTDSSYSTTGVAIY